MDGQLITEGMFGELLSVVNMLLGIVHSLLTVGLPHHKRLPWSTGHDAQSPPVSTDGATWYERT